MRHLLIAAFLVALALGCSTKRQPEADAAAAKETSHAAVADEADGHQANAAQADQSAAVADLSTVPDAPDAAEADTTAPPVEADAAETDKPDAAQEIPSEPPTRATFERTMRRDGQGTLRAVPMFAHLVVRTQWPIGQTYGNLIYEGNNSAMRGDEKPDGTYEITGLDVAERWRTWGRASRGVFLLRDSLWNQQDHVGRYEPVGLMLSPSWVTVAVHEASLGHAPPRLGIPADFEDDVAWAALSPEALFGPFPPSETLHQWATDTLLSTDPLSATRIRATRATLLLLDGYLASLAEVAPQGPEAVAARGAELICQSDRDYFTPELRRDVFIPLLVENPYPHELNDEGKSFRVSGREVPDAILDLTRTTVLRRRLADGDIAIERYDLSDGGALEHLVSVVAPLVPAGEDGNTLWVWVTGPVEEEGEWKGPPALDYKAALDAKLQAAGVNLERIRVVTRNPAALSSKTSAEELKTQSEAHAAAGWALRLNMRSSVLKKKLEELVP